MPDQSSSSPTPQELHIRLTELENAVKSLTDTVQRASAASPIVCSVCSVCHPCIACRPICYECRPICYPCICYECGGCGPCLQQGGMR